MDKLRYVRPLRPCLFSQRFLDLEKSGGLKVFSKTKQIAEGFFQRAKRLAKRNTRLLDSAKRLFHAPLPNPIIRE